MPGSLGVPSMDYVLPLLVCPYAMMLTFYPSKELITSGLTSSKTSSCDAAMSNTQLYSKLVFMWLLLLYTANSRLSPLVSSQSVSGLVLAYPLHSRGSNLRTLTHTRILPLSSCKVLCRISLLRCSSLSLFLIWMNSCLLNSMLLTSRMLVAN